MPSIGLDQRFDLSASKAYEGCAYLCVVTELEGKVRMKPPAGLEPTPIRAGQERSRVGEDGRDRCLVLGVERVRFLVGEGLMPSVPQVQRTLGCGPKGGRAGTATAVSAPATAASRSDPPSHRAGSPFDTFSVR